MSSIIVTRVICCLIRYYIVSWWVALRLDIAFVVHQVSQFMKYPCHLHLVVAHHIIRYLKGTSTQGQFFPTRQVVILIDYSDVRLCWLSRYTEIDHWLMHVSWF